MVILAGITLAGMCVYVYARVDMLSLLPVPCVVVLWQKLAGCSGSMVVTLKVIFFLTLF